jgi:dihydroneopterin aldolase|tara:strand:- start:157 stop:525 length:369 start_codon:yes stop_codon:yes gene_type:complete
MDSIRIKNLRIPARHGVYEFEKEKDGTFELDLELYLPLLKAGKSDRLEDTINYEDIISTATKAFTDKHYALVEAAAGSVCDRLLTEFDIDKITIRVRKPHAPIDADFDTVEIELNRKNEDKK